MRKPLAHFALAAIFLSAPLVLRAQESAGLTGVVTDNTGAAIPDAQVVLTNPNTGVRFTTQSDSHGSYRFPQVPAGPGYVEVVTHEGFAATNFKNLYLNVGITRTQDVKLQAGATTEIEVSSSVLNTINTTDATIGNNFDVTLLNDLPVQSRTSPTALFSLQPGIANGSVTGARTDQSNVTLDGMDVSDIVTGSTFTIVGGAPVDAVQEFRGTTAGKTSMTGTGSGGQFQMVSKSGSNSWHGNLNEYHRDTSTVANSWFNNNAGTPRTALIRNQFGGALGGYIKHDKLFFFLDLAESRIAQSYTGTRVVPLDSYRNGTLNYINNTAGCTASARLTTAPQCISSLSAADVAARDPQHLGFNQALFNFIATRYPHANDLSLGDGVNTGGYRFVQRAPDNQHNYLARVDYNITPTQKIFVQFHQQWDDSTYAVNQFDTDQLTRPYSDRSYGYVISHTWVRNNKVNQFYYGDNISKVAFPLSYNPSGTTSYTFGAGLSAPYYTGSQARRVPVPAVRDDYNWTVGHHTLQLGGQFKFIKTHTSLVNNYNFVSVGLGGGLANLGTTTGGTPIRPANLLANTTVRSQFDGAYTFALGRLASQSANYVYDASGNAVPQGNGAQRAYRYYQTELYVGDTWKATPNLTITYGLRWQLYTVPYEVNGSQSAISTGFDSYFGARVAQAAAGVNGNTAVPFISYALGGKANNAAPLYNQSYKDFAPRLALAYSPDQKTVFNASFGLDFDRTVVSAINFIQDQLSPVFQNTQTKNYGSSNAVTALTNDPRIGANLAVPSYPAPSPVTKPLTQNISNGAPIGLGNNTYNYAIDPNFKSPYSITFNAGVQRAIPGAFVLRANYVGRLGRRLIGQADASQLTNFVDKVSGTTLEQGFAKLENELRASGGASYTQNAWMNNVLTASGPKLFGYNTPTDFIAQNFADLVTLGDIADIFYYLANYQNVYGPAYGVGFVPANTGLASQYSGNAFITNKGWSTYHGGLVTLSKNPTHGIRGDVNYTFSHNIDNVSAVANSIGANSGLGQICDALDVAKCRGNSDNDIKHVVNSNIIYNLPFGHGRQFFSSSNRIVDTVIGGWDVSGVIGWRSGLAFTAVSGAYLMGFNNNAPPVFTGNRSALNTRIHKTGSQLYLYNNPATAQASFVAPTGFGIGSRNNLRGPSAFTMDMGLAKSFRLTENRFILKFRADAYNVLNHPTFSTPSSTDYTSGTFGQITGVSTASRVAQFALRLEF